MLRTTSFALALLVLSTAVHATEPQIKRNTQGYAGACQSPDRLVQDGIFGTTTAPAKVYCSPDIDSSQNGATAFGLTVTNTSTTLVRTITCVAKISTAKPGPQILVPRTVMISPRKHGQFTWTAAEVGEGKTFRGGQVGIACNLPTGASVHNVWTQSVGN